MSKVVAQDRKSSNKRPTIWVYLGMGDIDFGEEGSFETV